ncbi:hypothetical protein VPHD52_0074 [Vibrio phage D52]
MCGFSRNLTPVVVTDSDIDTYLSLRLSGITEKSAVAYLRSNVPRSRRHTLLGVRKSIKLWELNL